MTARDVTQDRTWPGDFMKRGVVCAAILAVLVLAGRFPLGLSSRVQAADAPCEVSIERIPSTLVPGTSVAVRVRNADLAHTTQLLPDVTDSAHAASQVSSLLALLQTVLERNGVTRSSVVKLNVYVRDFRVRAIFVEELSRWTPDAPPAVAFVASTLPDRNAAVALDAVFVVQNVSKTGNPYSVRGGSSEGEAGSMRVSVLPPGDVVYVSGQAAAGELAEATTQTLDGLLKTIKAIGLDRSHIVQIKTFMKPMSQADVVDREIAAFFGKDSVPPVSHVEWLSGSRPIEIELVAWAPEKVSKDTVSYFTPEWMESSPVFSRVARIHGNDRVYVSGIEAASAGDGEGQVRSVFESLQDALTAAGSDLRHLAKATYYVSDAETSSQLNALRPSYYDPARPPAASKAMVADVGIAERTISLDIIAAPTKSAQKSREAPDGPEEGARSKADDTRASVRISVGIDVSVKLSAVNNVNWSRGVFGPLGVYFVHGHVERRGRTR
jgi:enamine deaminase RidA (YjgF/YER057c/UK114 family)